MAFELAGSFAENPIIKAVGNQLGVGGILAAPSAASQAPAPPPPPKPAKSGVQAGTPREFRQHAPEPHTRGFSPGQATGAGMNLPGVMSPDVLMHPAVQQLLGQYGISPEQIQDTAQGANPNLFLENPAAYQNHPILANAFERGLEGLAFTHGGNTWGESLSNIAQGLLNAHAARIDKYNNQLMTPFAQANQVLGLQNASREEQFREAEAKRAESQANYYDQLPEIKTQLAAIQQQRANDLESYHKQESNWHMQQVLQRTPLNDDENKALQDMIPAGGTLDDVDPEKLAGLISTAAARKNKEDNAAKMTRAQVAAGAHIRGAEISSNNRGNDKDYKAAHDEYETAVKNSQQFQKDLNSGMATYNGKMYVPGADTSEATNALNADIAAAKAKLDRFTDQGSTPLVVHPAPKKSANPKSAPKKQAYYNPSTNKIEYR